MIIKKLLLLEPQPARFYIYHLYFLRAGPGAGGFPVGPGGAGGFPGGPGGGPGGRPGGGGPGGYPGGSGTGGGAGGGYGGNGAPGGGGRPGAVSEIPITQFENVNNGDGTYSFSYQTGNGISAQEQGDARGDGTQAQGTVKDFLLLFKNKFNGESIIQHSPVRWCRCVITILHDCSPGSFSYTSPDGQQIQIQYSADERGFVPQGDHLPTSPPIPEEIQRAIEQNLADEARGIVDDGQYKPGPDEGGSGGGRGGGGGGGGGIGPGGIGGPGGGGPGGISPQYGAPAPSPFRPGLGSGQGGPNGYRY